MILLADGALQDDLENVCVRESDRERDGVRRKREQESE